MAVPLEPEFDKVFADKPVPGFHESDEVREAAEALIAAEARLAEFRGFEIRWLLRVAKRPADDAELDALVRVVRVPALYYELLHADLVGWVHSWLWEQLEDRTRAAALAHALAHWTTDENARLVPVRHDVSEFGWVAKRWGLWYPSHVLFRQQLQLFETEPKKEIRRLRTVGDQP